MPDYGLVLISRAEYFFAIFNSFKGTRRYYIIFTRFVLIFGANKDASEDRKAKRPPVSICANSVPNFKQKNTSLELPEGSTQIVYLEGVPFTLHLVRQVFANEDGSTGVRYLVTSDLTLEADQIIPIYQKRWKVEEYHRSLKQNTSLAKSPTRTVTIQTNHLVAALWSFVKIELLKVQTNKNHYQVKAQLYLSALQQAFQELRIMQAELSSLPSAA
ncbi:MAG: transposase [Anaerolineales bacterium]|nr:transposase [Anaerolineales bacterium]